MSQSRISHYDFEFDYGLFARDVVPLLDALKRELGGASDRLFYTTAAADGMRGVDLGGRRII